MSVTAFSAPGRFYRGNLHTHSNLSDGALDPSEVCRRYKAEGYDFISLTDHFVGLYDYPITDKKSFRDAEFTTIPGAELHSGAMENGEIWHILAVGLPEDFAPSNSPAFDPVEEQETGPELAVNINPSDAETPTLGRERSFFDELFGGIGQVGQAGLPGGAGPQ